MRASALIFAVAVLPLAALPARAGQLIVVEARGISLAPGSSVDDSKPLELKQGQHVTLISQSGVTVSLDGPYNKPPAIAAQSGLSLGSKLSGLVTEANARTGEVGTTRKGSSIRQLPSAWVIDAARAGTACLQEGQTPVFWRDPASATASLTVMPDDRSWKVLTEWPAGLSQLAVKTNIPMHPGATYFVSLDGSESAIAVNMVPAALSSDEQRAAWMADKGCEAQAEALARNLR
jgi:hypothetical protein